MAAWGDDGKNAPESLLVYTSIEQSTQDSLLYLNSEENLSRLLLWEDTHNVEETQSQKPQWSQRPT